MFGSPIQKSDWIDGNMVLEGGLYNSNDHLSWGNGGGGMYHNDLV